MSCSERVSAILDALDKTDLRPGPVVDSHFQELVAVASNSPGAFYALEESTLARCRQICSRGEFELEQHWSSVIQETPSALEHFPYRQNYADLTDYEELHVLKNTQQVKRWAFVGSGPLPLSVYFLAVSHKYELTCIDNSAHAHAQGRAVLDALVPGNSVQHILAHASEVNYADYDAITLAALVGDSSQGKQAVIEHISTTMRPETTLAVRSVPADGRQLLYPRVENLPQVVHCHGEPAPPAGVINSVMIVHRDHHTKPTQAAAVTS